MYAAGAKISARSVAPNTPIPIETATGGQKPPPASINGRKPAIVVNVVAITCRVDHTTTFLTARGSPARALSSSKSSSTVGTEPVMTARLGPANPFSFSNSRNSPSIEAR